ncbi:MAG: hypothetical protein RXO23_03850 [Vulcanisaeta sp.]
MPYGFRLRGLIIKALIFLVMAIAAVVGMKFTTPIFALIIMLTLVVLIVMLNGVVNKKLDKILGRQILSIGSYIIYERGIYVKPIDIFYPWSELKDVINNSDSITLVFRDGTEISLPGSVNDYLRRCGCVRK